MGIIRRATDFAVVRETGRYPLMFDVVNILNYYKRLCTSDDILLKNAYEESSAAHNQDKFSWIGCVKTSLTFLDLDIFALSQAKKQSIINKLKSVYKKVWNKENGKMLETN